MPYRRIPNSMPAIIRTLRTARDTYKITASGERAISADQWAKLDDTDDTSLLNRLLKDASDVDLALAGQAPLTNALSQVAARLTMLVSHFHQVFDLAVARGIFAPGDRSYYGRDISATTIPDLSTYDAVQEAAEKIVSGEAARAAAQTSGVSRFDTGLRFDKGFKFDTVTTVPFVPMAMPSAAEIGELLTQFVTLRNQVQTAEVNTDAKQEVLSALYAEAQALAVDICDTVEFYYRKDPDPSSRRAKCARWGVVYVYDANEPAPPPPTPSGPTPPTP